MKSNLTYDRPIQALGRTYCYEEERHPQEGAARSITAALTVALSYEAGTPAHEVAEEVGRRLNWPVYDHELLEQIANDLGLPVRLLEGIDEKPQHWLMECIEGFGNGEWVSESRYFMHLIQIVHKIGEKGRCVIVGRGAAYLLPSYKTLRVRLVGDWADRVLALSHRFHVAEAEAVRREKKLSRDRTRFIEKHFHKDPAAPQNYDLILNASQWSVTKCAGLILQALQNKQES